MELISAIPLNDEEMTIFSKERFAEEEEMKLREERIDNNFNKTNDDNITYQKLNTFFKGLGHNDEEIKDISDYLIVNNLNQRDFVINLTQSIIDYSWNEVKVRLNFITFVLYKTSSVFDLNTFDILEEEYITYMDIYLKEISGVKLPNSPCRACGNIEFLILSVQTRSIDEGTSIFKSCLSCGVIAKIQ